MAAHINHTIDQLLVLDSIHRTGSFGAAAKELHRVPSAISYSIKSLEENVNIQIFDRSRQRAFLTPEGKRILEEGRKVIEQARQLEYVATQIKDGWEPELRIVTDGVLSMKPFSQALRVFAEKEIPTRIRIDVEYQEGVIERFHEDHES